jgi:hypothetical protein
MESRYPAWADPTESEPEKVLRALGAVLCCFNGAAKTKLERIKPKGKGLKPVLVEREGRCWAYLRLVRYTHCHSLLKGRVANEPANYRRRVTRLRNHSARLSTAASRCSLGRPLRPSQRSRPPGTRHTGLLGSVRAIHLSNAGPRVGASNHSLDPIVSSNLLRVATAPRSGTADGSTTRGTCWSWTTKLAEGRLSWRN